MVPSGIPDTPPLLVTPVPPFCAGVLPPGVVASAGAESSALTSATTASAPYTPVNVIRRLGVITGFTHTKATESTASVKKTHLSAGAPDSTMDSTNSTGSTPQKTTIARTSIRTPRLTGAGCG